MFSQDDGRSGGPDVVRRAAWVVCIERSSENALREAGADNTSDMWKSRLGRYGST